MHHPMRTPDLPGQSAFAPHAPPRRQADTPAERCCLRCATPFWSDGFGERVCKRCKSTSAWKSAGPSAAGQSRRR